MMRLLLLVALATPATAFFTCSAGAWAHDWIIFDDWPDRAQVQFLDQVAVRAAASDLLPQGAKNNIGACKRLVQGMSIGWHQGRTLNGMARDTQATKLFGCPAPATIPVHDKPVRAIAMVACAMYSSDNYRDYRIDAGTHGVGAFFTRALNPSIPSGRRASCGSGIRSSATLLDRNRQSGIICWNFIEDVKDLVCNYLFKGRNFGTIGVEDEILQALIGDRYESYLTVRGDLSEVVRAVPEGEVAYRRRRATCAADFGDDDGQRYRFEIVPSPRQREAIAKRQEMEAMQARRDGGIAAVQAEGGAWEVTRGNIISNHGRDYDLKPVMTLDGVDTCVGPTPVSNRGTRRRLQGYCGTSSLSEADSLKLEEGRAGSVPFMEADGTAPDPAAAPSPSMWHRSRGSSRSSGRLSKISATWLSYQSYNSLEYSQLCLDNSAKWLEGKLGRIGKVFGAPLRLVSRAIGGIKYAVGRAMFKLARNLGLCSPDMDDHDCICNVIDPMMDAIDDVWRTPPELDPADRHAGITLSYSWGAHAGLGPFGVGASGGMYVTFHWKIADRISIGFELGAYGDASTAVSIGTDVVSLGATIGPKLGVFFGLASQKSEWSKGVSFGIEAGPEVHMSVELMFKAEYVDLEFKTRCNPLRYGTQNTALQNLGRFLVFPVNPFCIRGFAIGLHGGAGVSAAAGAKFNVYTALSASRKVAILTWNTVDGIAPGRANAVGNRVIQGVQEMITGERDRRRRRAEDIAAARERLRIEEQRRVEEAARIERLQEEQRLAEIARQTELRRAERRARRVRREESRLRRYGRARVHELSAFRTRRNERQRDIKRQKMEWVRDVTTRPLTGWLQKEAATLRARFFGSGSTWHDRFIYITQNRFKYYTHATSVGGRADQETGINERLSLPMEGCMLQYLRDETTQALEGFSLTFPDGGDGEMKTFNFKPSTTAANALPLQSWVDGITDIVRLNLLPEGWINDEHYIMVVGDDGRPSPVVQEKALTGTSGFDFPDLGWSYSSFQETSSSDRDRFFSDSISTDTSSSFELEMSEGREGARRHA